MCRYLILFIAITYAHLGSAQNSRDVGFDLSLDQPSKKSLRLEVSVRNHSFVVVPPSFTIIRPIISSTASVIEIPAGSKEQRVTVRGVSPSAVDYSIRIRCLNCQGIVPTQFYRLVGDVGRPSRVLVDDAYLSPEDLDSLPGLELETFVFVSGVLQLKESKFAFRPANVKVTLLDSLTGAQVGLPAFIRLNTNAPQEFQIDGLRRQEGTFYSILVECQTCQPKRLILDQRLDGAQSQTDVNILLELGAPSLSGVIPLLLDE